MHAKYWGRPEQHDIMMPVASLVRCSGVHWALATGQICSQFIQCHTLLPAQQARGCHDHIVHTPAEGRFSRQTHLWTLTAYVNCHLIWQMSKSTRFGKWPLTVMSYEEGVTWNVSCHMNLAFCQYMMNARGLSAYIRRSLFYVEYTGFFFFRSFFPNLWLLCN